MSWRKHLIRIIAIVCVLGAVSVYVYKRYLYYFEEDVLYMTTGETIRGKLIDTQKKNYLVKISPVDTLKIPRDKVSTIYLDQKIRKKDKE